ncbi:ATP-binding protein [Neorhizobium sp. NCHU2750]|uniref:PAS domain-containing sensor histidine kinase n=1 Tax=Neorhizobium sp. NCHU2750 TaxID=1825976 RepID=UPI000E72CA74|nr:ATPase [Neorhizobium sp. NCHU2750]
MALAAALALVIFTIDTFTMLASAVAVLYVLVIVLAGDLGSKRIVRTASAVCATFTVISFLISHANDWETQATLRLLFSLAANIVTTLLLLRRVGDEAALKESEHRYRTIFETLAIAIWENDFRHVMAELTSIRESGITDLRQYLADHPGLACDLRRSVRITDVNQTALTLMGIPSKQEFFTSLDDFLPDRDGGFVNFLVALFEGQRDFQSETTVRSRDGRLIPILVAISFPKDGTGLDRIQASIVDMTERHQFQEALEASRQELEQASRAAMIGEISASIAHEVNQPLSAIMTCVQAGTRWLDRTPPDISEARAALQDAAAATEHAAQVVRRVRMLLGKSKSESAKLSVDAVLGEAAQLKQKELLTAGVELQLSLGAPAAVIRGDKILLQQAFINIITNAIHAMETVRDDSRSLRVESRQDKDGIAIRFLDSGAGLGMTAPETLFKPFNTTKVNGMGLGLAMCRSITMAHSGNISLRNRDDGKGAIVEIRLPSHVDEMETAEPLTA